MNTNNITPLAKERLEALGTALVAKILSEKNLEFAYGWIRQPQSNPITGTIYKGGNQIILATMAMVEELSEPLWGTAKAITKEGGSVKGLSGTPTLQPLTFKKKEFNEDGSPWMIQDPKNPSKKIQKTRTVFTGKFRVNYLFPLEKASMDLSEYALVAGDGFELPCEVEELVASWACPIKNGTKAYYMPGEHYIGMPKREKFFTPEDYQRTLFHELTHSTGEKMKRDLSGSKESLSYALEELVAEFGAVILCATFGIEYKTSTSAAYLQGWVSKVQEHKAEMELFDAFSKAQSAVTMLLNHHEKVIKENIAA